MESGAPLGPNQDGEICLRGPIIMKGNIDPILGSFSTRTGDHDGNESETIKLIEEDKRRT